MAQIRTVLTSPESIASVVRQHPSRGPDRRGQHGDGDGAAQRRVGSPVPSRAPPHRNLMIEAHRPRPHRRFLRHQVKWRGSWAGDKLIGEFAPRDGSVELMESRPDEQRWKTFIALQFKRKESFWSTGGRGRTTSASSRRGSGDALAHPARHGCCSKCGRNRQGRRLMPTTVGRLLRLARLAPDIIEQLMQGCQPEG